MKSLNALFAGKALSELGVRICRSARTFRRFPPPFRPSFSNAAPTWPGRSAGFAANACIGAAQSGGAGGAGRM